MKAWFISDIHLKSAEERNGEILLRFLQSLLQKPDNVTHLFLLGDIFDMWVGDHDLYYHKFQSIVDLLIQLKLQGVEIVYFEGNHDIHVRRFWRRHGISCYYYEQYFTLGPWQVRAEHGDHLNPKEVFYQRCLQVIRWPIVSVLTQSIPAKWMNDFGERMSQKSRQKSTYQRRTNESELHSMIRQYARKTYLQKPFDYFVSGHVHVKDDFEFREGERSVHSINLGSWFSQPQALLLTEQGHQWIDLN